MHNVKLQHPPRRRMRVREVAAELGLTSADVMRLLAAIGEYVSSPQQYLELPIVRVLHDRCGVTYSDPETRTTRTESPDNPPSRSLTRGLTAPEPQARRNNNPLSTELPQHIRRRPQRRSRFSRLDDSMIQNTWTSADDGERYAAASGAEAAPAWEYLEWQVKGFTETERDVWMAAGLRASQAKWAATLRDAGLTPSDLGADLNGWSVLNRLRKGEGAAAVARLLRAARTQDTA